MPINPPNRIRRTEGLQTVPSRDWSRLSTAEYVSEYVWGATQSTLLNDMNIAYQEMYTTSLEQALAHDLDNKTPVQRDKRLTLIRQMEMDATDLILHLIKKQPRIIGSGLYSYDTYVERVQHNYQRDTILRNGSWVIYYKGTLLGRLVRKPHASFTVFDVPEKGQARYALGVFTRVAADLLPITIRRDKK
mgnify:CR=1 FL=1